MFKKGDRVIGVGEYLDLQVTGLHGTVKHIFDFDDNFIGVEWDKEIVGRGHDGGGRYSGKKGYCFNVYAKNLRPETKSDGSNKILITSDGATTLARLYDGEKVTKTATAKCSPDDKFDFLTGAKLAFERLVGEDKPKAKPEFPHKFGIDECVKIADSGATYSTYKEWLDSIAISREMRKKWEKGCAIPNKSICRVVAYAKHLTGSNVLYAVLNEESTRLVIIDESGLEGAPVEDKPAPSFDWEAFKAGKIAVHCDSEEKAKAFLKECDEKGLTWGSGRKTTACTRWEDYTTNTCYTYNYCGVKYGNRDYYSGEHCIIIPYPFPAQDKPRTYAIGGKEYPLVKREAKVGEYVYMVENMGGTLKPKTIHKCTGEGAFGDMWCHISSCYLVLDGYKPEEKPEYYNGKVVCVKAGNFHTVGKVYEFKNGVVSDNTEDLDYNPPVKTLEEFNKNNAVNFIPFVED